VGGDGAAGAEEGANGCSVHGVKRDRYFRALCLRVIQSENVDTLPCVRLTGGDHSHTAVDALCLACPRDPLCLLRFHFVRASVFGSCPAFCVSLGLVRDGPIGRQRWGRDGVKRQILFDIGSRYEHYIGRHAVFFFPLQPLSP